MLCPIHPPRQSAAEAARQHQNQQRAAQRRAGCLANPRFDPQLLKPVGIQPAPPMSAAERARLEAERTCLIRERDNVQRGIDYLTAKLAA